MHLGVLVVSEKIKFWCSFGKNSYGPKLAFAHRTRARARRAFPGIKASRFFAASPSTSTTSLDAAECLRHRSSSPSVSYWPRYELSGADTSQLLAIVTPSHNPSRQSSSELLRQSRRCPCHYDAAEWGENAA
jgi:hypothetical protein